MSLIPEQDAFLQDVAKLIQHGKLLGFTLTAGEVWRTPEQQDIYLKTGRSTTAKSQHLSRLAIDLNIFKNGKLCTRDEIEPLGDYWESLHTKNRWGGSWRGQVEAAQEKGVKPFIDAPHFERLV